MPNVRLNSYKEKVATSADFLLSRRNPNDGGWGLNIEKGYQASSIVNTAEALYVINRAGKKVPDISSTLGFLVDAIDRHHLHSQRGDNLRFLTYGLLGLLEANLAPDDDVVRKTANTIESRYIADIGWGEQPGDDVRIWPTFQSLWLLIRVFGVEYVERRYRKALERLVETARSNNYRLGFVGINGQDLAPTAYLLLLCEMIYPKTPHVGALHKEVLYMLNAATMRCEMLEVEPIHGTDWHHYSYCWALKALHAGHERVSETVHNATLSTLRYINTLFREGCGFKEPGKNICNVRSIFNNVLAIDAVVQSFDPGDYFMVEQYSKKESIAVKENSVFLSFSYRETDKELAAGVKLLLTTYGFTVITGENNDIGSLSQSILTKIKQSQKILVLMTRRDQKNNNLFTTSSWLLEEKGAAIALGKPCLMMVESDVDVAEIGGMQGDDARIHFNRDNFTSKVAEAIRMLSGHYVASS
jgi:hypothetical protein